MDNADTAEGPANEGRTKPCTEVADRALFTIETSLAATSVMVVVLSETLMIVRTGITSFYWRKKLPEFPFDDFKRIVYACAARLDFLITDVRERDITPNFHDAILNGNGERVHVLGHSNFPIFAFAEPREDYSCELVFRDMDSVSNLLEEMFPYVAVAKLEELSRQITDYDLSQLDRAELEQVKYWKPATIGQLVFNWWD